MQVAPKLTIFHLDGERGLRGGEKQLLYLASGLTNRGHKNIVVCKRNSDLAKEAKRFNLKTIELPLLGEWDLYSAFKLRGILKNYPQSIVHSHAAHAALTAFWASRNLPVYRVAHRRINFPVSSRLSYQLKYDSADCVLTVSQNLYDQMAEQARGGANIRFIPSAIYMGKLKLLYDGIELTKFDIGKPNDKLKEKLLLKPGTKILINVGALTPQKDQSTLLKAIAILKTQTPADCVFKLLIVGEGPLQNALIQEAEALGIESDVQFLGFRKDIPNLLAISDIFVLSSTAEGFCNALLEAMAAGLPIAATLVGGNEEIVINNETGLIVPPKDPKALANALRELLMDPVRTKAYGASGKNRVQQFSVKNMVENIESIYFELVKSPK